MKNYLFLLLIGLAYGTTAQDLQIKVSSTTDYSKPNYAAKSDLKNDSDKAKIILGYSINVEAEQHLTGIVSYYGGIGYKQKRFKPQSASSYDLLGYSLISSYQLSSTFNPEKHQIYLLSIPIGVKLKSRKTKKVSPYVAIGLVSDFIFSESETYNDRTWQGDYFTDVYLGYTWYTEDNEQTYTEKEFDYYGTAVNVGFGFDVAVSDIHTISFFSDFNAIEYRKENQRMNNDVLNLWDNSFYMFGEISLGLGVQCRL